MKKFGFTLAEILIALAIVGVVAAISIPTMVTENKKKIYANSLSAAVSSLENAITTAIITDGQTSIEDTSAWKNSVDKFVTELLAKRMQLTTDGSFDANEIKTFNKAISWEGLGLDELRGNGCVFESKKGYTGVIFDKLSKVEQPTLRLSKPVALVVIDVTGNKKPNILGRDVFLYILNNDGYLFPYGGDAYNRYTDKNYDITKHCNPKSSDSNNGVACAARLAQNGYKMDY